MASTGANVLLRHLQDLAADRAAAQVADRDLLRRFARQHDEGAFAALLRRHAAMVYHVCRRTLNHAHDAEDACQATFLVLAARAGSAHWQPSLAGWLHETARRVALKARTAAARRERREVSRVRTTHPAPTPLDEITARELQETLDDELARLPEKYRAPLVLCYLEGATRDEAARQLGWATSTLKQRVERGREILRARLLKRGLSLTAVLGGATLAAGPAPAAMLQSTIRAARSSLHAASPHVLALVRESLAPMLTPRAKLAAALLLAASLVTTAVGYRLSANGQPAEAEPQRTTQEPAAEGGKSRTDAHGDPLPQGAVARLGTVRFNHGDGLNALYFLPDGKTILSEGGGTICLWDADTGKELDRSVTAETSFDDQTFLAADGKTLTSLNQGWDDTLRVWDISQGKETRSMNIPLRRSLQSVYLRNAVSPDGKLCALNMEKEVRVLESASAREVWKKPFERNDEGRPLTFAGPDILVTADKQENIYVWQARSGELVRQFKHGAPVQVLAATSDGKRLATLEHHTYAIDRHLDKDVIRIWDLATGTEKHQLASRPKRWTLNMRFTPDGKRLLSSCTGSGSKGIVYELTIWDVETGKRLREMPDTVAQVMAVSPNGKRVACGANPGKFELFDMTNGKPLSSGGVEGPRATSVALSSDGKRATTVGWESVATWDASTGRRLRSFELPNYAYAGPYLSPDGRYVVSYKVNENEADEIQVWDVAAGKPLKVVWHPEKKTYHYTSAFDARSTLLACAFAGKVHLADLRSEKEVGSFAEKSAGWPWQPFFSPDAKTLFIADMSKVAGHDVASGKELFAWRMEPLPDNSGIRVAAIPAGGGAPVEQERSAWRKFLVSPTGNLAACVLSGGFSRNPVADRLALCDVRTGRLIRRWSDSGKLTNGYEELAFSADGRLLASSDHGHVIHLWEVATGKEVRTFRGHRGEIHSLAFSADGRRLASSSTDSTVLVWDLVPALPASKPDDATFTTLWTDLCGDDAVRAYAAVWRLAGASDAAVAFLRRHVRPVPQPDKAQLRRLIDDLDSETFTVRENAHKELANLDTVALPALREALTNNPSVELRRRIEKLLERRPDLVITAEILPQLRALHALEQIGSKQVQQLLCQLAAGARDAHVTREAKAALERLSHK
jgi:RNA polymerase sigma factor (sigma-70 family)